MESENDEEIFAREQIMPDGIVEIIFHYADPYYTYQDNNKFIQPPNFAISMMRKCVEIESSGKTGFISVRFYPWGAYHFFNEPIQHFLDQTINAEILWKDQNAAVMSSLRSADTAEQKIQIVQAFLSARLAEHKREEPAVDAAIKLIRHSKGQLTMEEVCKKTGFSKKQLERKFVASVGTTPKVFSRITRFLNICKHLEENKHKTLTALAHECGFHDQAHFIKEFKAFSGFTPKEFFAKNNVVFSEL
jgi:AraC-like DNA-binding protein